MDNFRLSADWERHQVITGTSWLISKKGWELSVTGFNGGQRSPSSVGGGVTSIEKRDIPDRMMGKQALATNRDSKDCSTKKVKPSKIC